MDFPLFFIDHLGNRLLMAVMAVLHVLVNHPVAIGGYTLICLLEWIGIRRRSDRLDEAARKITFSFFLITTTVGALSGVGIWITSALIAPFAIGSLLRVFFYAWAIEWLVFIIELVLVLVYFLTWRKWREGNKKKLHLFVGVLLAVFSWITMAIITAILGFMMDPGSWKGNGAAVQVDYLSAFMNPIYLPQLVFRTSFAFVSGGLLMWFCLGFVLDKENNERHELIKKLGFWILFWLAVNFFGALWYWESVPHAMQKNAQVALMTVTHIKFYNQTLILMGVSFASILAVAVIGVLRPKVIPAFILIIPFVLSLWLLGHFERVREFIRKPYVIGDYMYANGVRKTELAVLQRDGVLKHAAYVKHRTVTEENKKEAGADVFMIACSRCHTSTGVNGTINKFNNLYKGRWNEEAMKAFIRNMDKTHPYMPPFPGNEDELEALVHYLTVLKDNPQTIPGAQEKGIDIPAKEGV